MRYMKSAYIFICIFVFCLQLSARHRISIGIPYGKELFFPLPLYKGTSDIIGPTAVKNYSDIPIILSLKVKTNSANWDPVDYLPGEDEFRAFGIFTSKYKALLVSDFHRDDIILDKFHTASISTYAISADKNKYKGYNIKPYQKRYLFFRIDTPSETAVIDQVGIRILIKAMPYIKPRHQKFKRPEQTMLSPNNDGINDVLIFPGLTGNFKIRILNAAGKIIKVITDKNQWDGTDRTNRVVPSGVYIYQYEYENTFITGLVIIGK